MSYMNTEPTSCLIFGKDKSFLEYRNLIAEVNTVQIFFFGRFGRKSIADQLELSLIPINCSNIR